MDRFTARRWAWWNRWHIQGGGGRRESPRARASSSYHIETTQPGVGDFLGMSKSVVGGVRPAQLECVRTRRGQQRKAAWWKEDRIDVNLPMELLGESERLNQKSERRTHSTAVGLEACEGQEIQPPGHDRTAKSTVNEKRGVNCLRLR